jgi:hypothetical protein
MDNYEMILQDLQQPISTTIVHPIHDNNRDLIQQVQFLLRQLRRAKSTNNRKEVLLNMWYLGEILESKAESSVERSRCLNLLTLYLRKVSVRTYYIFEFLGPEQIYQTRNTTSTMVFRLTTSQYRSLQDKAVTIAGARL